MLIIWSSWIFMHMLISKHYADMGIQKLCVRSWSESCNFCSTSTTTCQKSTCGRAVLQKQLSVTRRWADRCGADGTTSSLPFDYWLLTVNWPIHYISTQSARQRPSSWWTYRSHLADISTKHSHDTQSTSSCRSLPGCQQTTWKPKFSTPKLAGFALIDISLCDR